MTTLNYLLKIERRLSERPRKRNASVLLRSEDYSSHQKSTRMMSYDSLRNSEPSMLPRTVEMVSVCRLL